MPSNSPIWKTTDEGGKQNNCFRERGTNHNRANYKTGRKIRELSVCTLSQVQGRRYREKIYKTTELG